MSETTINAVETAEKVYTLRELEARDIAPMASILSKIGIKDIKECFNGQDLKDMASGKADEATINAIGMSIMLDIVGIVLENYSKCQDNVFKFLASLSGMDAKQIESLPIDIFTEMIIDVVKKEEFKDFFKVVSKLLK